MDCNNLTALATQKPRPTSCQTLVAGYVSAREGLLWGGCLKVLWMPESIVEGKGRLPHCQ